MQANRTVKQRAVIPVSFAGSGKSRFGIVFIDVKQRKIMLQIVGFVG